MASYRERGLLPPKRILLVSTVGGATNSTPVLEIGKVLHARGHTVDYATLDGQQKVAARFPYLNEVHILGRGMTPEEDEEVYSRASRWGSNHLTVSRDIAFSKTFLDSFWVENYPNLKKLVSTIHYDFIFSDYQCDAAKDVMVEHNIPLAQMWPQAPPMLAPHPWVPGTPIMQQRCLTSEHASIYDRLYEMTFLLKFLPWLLQINAFTRRMRQKAGIKRKLNMMQKKPDHLVFINSFFGLEVPKDLPPLMNCIGPVLSDEIAPLDARSSEFLNTHSKVAFIALGTHVRLNESQFERLIAGLSASASSGHVDGVIWALPEVTRRHIDRNKPVTSSNPKLQNMTYGDLLDNAFPPMLFIGFAAQRAILTHPSTRVFITHCGASSANEGAFHGKPMLTLAIYGDQMSGAMRLRGNGVALSLDKTSFTAEELAHKLATIIQDKDGLFALNCLRLRRLAVLASNGKERAADLIEQHLYHHELRFDPGTGKSLVPMHLQTADARMSAFKANNWDLTLLGLAAVGGVFGLALAIAKARKR